MTTFHNVHAVLVHERPDAVVDVVRNLRHLDPDSTILLYNGGRDPRLLDRLFAPDEEPLVHPHPRSLAWGRLHDFALDCMRYALETVDFDTLTIVDSDQLATRPGYSGFLGGQLDRRAHVGMLGNAPLVQPRDTRIGPPAAAVKELDLWRPFLRRFEGGEEKFPHWTFWPTTVFTASAARALVDLVAGDAQLRDILDRTEIWATEEVILPTLVALLGFEIAQNPCSYEFVKYKARYTPRQLSTACARPDVFWVHPVPRRPDDPLRQRLRARFGSYEPAQPPTAGETGLVLTWPILQAMRRVEGWLEEDEADLLIAATARAVSEQPQHPIVEVGSYCGRSTTVLGSVVKALGAATKVYAVDSHEGEIGAADQGLRRTAPTLARFNANMSAAGLTGVVECVRQRSYEVSWRRPIGLLLVDALHDYANVSRDFWHFEEHVVVGGYVAFHDYADYYPGVKALVHEVLGTGCYHRVHLARSLMVVRKTAAGARRTSVSSDGGPLVSCVLPTFDRRGLLPQAIAYFLRQDYEPRELIVVDDGTESVARLLPDDSRIRHLRLDRRRTIGAKRNAGCDAAAGELVANWDDDDWISRDRLSKQVRELLAADADVCGLNRMLYYEPASGGAWLYKYPGDHRSWLSDGTLLFRRGVWRTNPFPDTSMGIDVRFLRHGRFRRPVALDDESIYVGMIHPGNTSPKHTRQSVWQPVPSERIHRLLGDDLAFYVQRVAAAAAT